MTTPLRVECTIPCRHEKAHGASTLRGSVEPAQTVGRLPRVARLMALALRFDRLVRAGEIKDYATLARLGKVSRARITQIMNLIHLAPAIQEAILFLPAQRGRGAVLLADLQPIAALPDWAKQRRRWRALRRGAGTTGERRA
jgi:hypothetical protein